MLNVLREVGGWFLTADDPAIAFHSVFHADKGTQEPWSRLGLEFYYSSTCWADYLSPCGRLPPKGASMCLSPLRLIRQACHRWGRLDVCFAALDRWLRIRCTSGVVLRLLM